MPDEIIKTRSRSRVKAECKIKLLPWMRGGKADHCGMSTRKLMILSMVRTVDWRMSHFELQDFQSVLHSSMTRYAWHSSEDVILRMGIIICR